MVAVLSERSDLEADDGSRTEWPARLALGFVRQGERTRMRRLEALGPLYVQKPFYPEGDACHVYLLHPPGGIAGGDRLEVDLAVASNAAAVLTTPAANKFYRCDSGCASVSQTFSVADAGSLEWLPQESIFFGGCRATLQTRVRLAPGGRFVGMELSCLGRPEAGDRFQAGWVDQRLSLVEVHANHERPLLLERNRWRAGSRVLSRPWGLAGYSVCGSLYATPVVDEAIRLVRERHAGATRAGADLIRAVTQINGVLIARVLAHEAEPARDWLRAVWEQVRPLVNGRRPSPPRIWRT